MDLKQTTFCTQVLLFILLKIQSEQKLTSPSKGTFTNRLPWALSVTPNLQRVLPTSPQLLYVYMCVDIGRLTQPFSTLFLRQGLSLNLKFTDSSRLVYQGVPRVLPSLLPSTGSTVMSQHFQCFKKIYLFCVYECSICMYNFM